MTRFRIPLLLLVALAALVVPASVTPAWPFGAGYYQVPCQNHDLLRCQDLVGDPGNLRNNNIIVRTFTETSCSVQEGHVTPGTHKLLRFTFTSPNVGASDLVVGSPSAHPEWFVYSPCHRHYHMRNYADYRLWDPGTYHQYAQYRHDNPFLTAEDVLTLHPELRAGFFVGEKRGFCVIDLAGPYPIPFPNSLFVQGQPSAKWFSCGNQGISWGYADVYHWSLDGQWILLDDVPPGTYTLESEVNAERIYAERDFSNNMAAIDITIP